MANEVSQAQFKFRQHEAIGQPAAEDDREFLSTCFEDTGDLDLLLDPTNLKCIVVGRTGSGKSALLLKMMERTDKSILIDLEDLALSYLTNSTILRKLAAMEVNLDHFFKVLWKHAFIIELIRLKFPMNNEKETRTFFDWLRNHFASDRKKDLALKYLEDHEHSFFQTAQLRIKEITGKLETSLKGALETKTGFFDADMSVEGNSSVEKKAEIAYLAQDIVSQSQLSELNTLFGIMKDDIFNEHRPTYYILVDRLDEGWIEDVFRYRLIRALLETAREFAKVPGVKIVLALRKDLIERVFQQTKDPGTQREKYHSHYLDIQWTKDQIMAVLNKRVEALVRRRYTKSPVAYTDLLPMSVGKVGIADFIVQRTHYRPRDVIMFFNACIQKSVGNPTVTLGMLRDAESEYSRARLQALYDEWRTDYPDLESYTPILKGLSPAFTVDGLDQTSLCDFCLERAALLGGETPDRLSRAARAVASGEMDIFPFIQTAISIFYRVGLVGLKTERFESTRWTFLQGAEVHYSSIDATCSVSICPAFYRCLGVEPPRSL